MGMKKLFRNSTHTSAKSHDCLIGEIGNIKNGGKKVKITYEAYNAIERCNTEFFDGDKWNHILSMLDMGVEPNTSAYNIWDENKRKSRADELFKKAETMCSSII
jgi:hypothetical protein